MKLLFALAGARELVFALICLFLHYLCRCVFCGVFGHLGDTDKGWFIT